LKVQRICPLAFVVSGIREKLRFRPDPAKSKVRHAPNSNSPTVELPPDRPDCRSFKSQPQIAKIQFQIHFKYQFKSCCIFEPEFVEKRLGDHVESATLAEIRLDRVEQFRAVLDFVLPNAQRQHFRACEFNYK
jgi:hypothetical protein